MMNKHFFNKILNSQKEKANRVVIQADQTKFFLEVFIGEKNTDIQIQEKSFFSFFFEKKDFTLHKNLFRKNKD